MTGFDNTPDFPTGPCHGPIIFSFHLAIVASVPGALGQIADAIRIRCDLTDTSDRGN